MSTILRAHHLARFSCLGERCEDTCCRGWSMQVDEETRQLFEKRAPELLEAVEPAQEAPWIMRKDDAGVCVKLEGGLCGIHKQYGDSFLSDACHFYPRVTRRLGGHVVMTAAMSCPEIVRLALAESDPCAMESVDVDRLPHALKDYAPPELSADDALAIHRAFVEAAQDEGASPERIVLRIAAASRALQRIGQKSWRGGVTDYLQMADALMLPAEENISDPFNLLHALCGLIVAARKKPSVRLQQTVDDMEKALQVTLDWEAVSIHTFDQSLGAYQQIVASWKKNAAGEYAPVLRRWLQMQLSLALFPFSGLGKDMAERITFIGVRFATLRLALMCGYVMGENALPQETAVRIVQSLSRFLDHLGDPAFSLQIYTETGWITETRMRGLIES